jgi:hypothetical protein
MYRAIEGLDTLQWLLLVREQNPMDGCNIFKKMNNYRVVYVTIIEDGWQ